MVGFNWAVSYFTYEKSNRLIIRNFKPQTVNQQTKPKIDNKEEVENITR
jgi:NADH dehydrogenase